MEHGADAETLRPFFSVSEKGVTAKSVVLPLGTTTAAFQVTFSGIICHAKLDTAGGDNTPRRSILVEGKTGMEHEPLLLLDMPAASTAVDVLKNQLATWTGNTPKCPDPVVTTKCSVDITGVDVRIRGKAGADPNSVALGPLGYDAKRSFECIVPRLKDHVVPGMSGNDIKPALTMTNPGFPASPATAYFEIDGGGTLAACPMASGGFYRDATMCEQFARKVFWVGETDGMAVVQLRSAKTSNDWKTITLNNAGRLDVRIKNEPPISTSMTSAHFELYETILGGVNLPRITPCNKPTVCVTCSSNQISIPGCSDSQWP